MSFCGKKFYSFKNRKQLQHNKIILFPSALLTHFSNLDTFFTVVFKPSESDTSTCKIVPFTFSCRLD